MPVEEQRFLVLMQFSLLLLMDYDFGLISNNSLCPVQGQTDFLLFSSKIFIYLALIFKQLTHFDFLLLL